MLCLLYITLVFLAEEIDKGQANIKNYTLLHIPVFFGHNVISAYSSFYVGKQSKTSDRRQWKVKVYFFA